jgi:hypothetical protein
MLSPTPDGGPRSRGAGHHPDGPPQGGLATPLAGGRRRQQNRGPGLDAAAAQELPDQPGAQGVAEEDRRSVTGQAGQPALEPVFEGPQTGELAGRRRRSAVARKIGQPDRPVRGQGEPQGEERVVVEARAAVERHQARSRLRLLAQPAHGQGHPAGANRHHGRQLAQAARRDRHQPLTRSERTAGTRAPGWGRPLPPAEGGKGTEGLRG